MPTDGSPPARRAIDRAVRFARQQKARVTGVWVGPVWEPNLYAYDKNVPPGFISPGRHDANVRKVGLGRLAPLKKAAAAARVSCRCVCVQGVFPYVEILKAARRNGCDLIVMGSHGRRGISKLLLGSQTEMVLAHSKIPVLVCR